MENANFIDYTDSQTLVFLFFNWLLFSFSLSAFLPPSLHLPLFQRKMMTSAIPLKQVPLRTLFF